MGLMQDRRESKVRILMCLTVFLLMPWFQPGGLGHAANLFVSTTGSGTVCSQDQPCSLETAVADGGSGDIIYVAAGTYTGTGDNVVELTEDILLYGGWNGALSGPVSRNPKLYQTVLDGENARRVIYIAPATSPAIDGFTIMQGNSTGLVTNCSGSSGNPDGCGGGIFCYQASPSITNNRIKANVATYTTLGYPIGTTGYGGGIYLKECAGVQVTDNTISDNTASRAADGAGGGIYLHACDENSAILRNEIMDNTGTTANRTGWGGGINIYSCASVVRGNTIEGNVASEGGSSQGSGLYQWYGSAPIQENTIIGNSRGSAVYLGHSGSTVERNHIWNNDVFAAVLMAYAVDVSLVNNVVVGSGTDVVYAFGSDTGPLAALLKHNTLVADSASYGVYVHAYSTMTMINNIVTGCGVSGIYVAAATSTITADHTLFFGNVDDGEKGTNPIVGNPLFRNPAGFDYHLRPRSAAVDAGVDAGITIDVEGKRRPMGNGYDIGAYELVSGFAPGVNLLLLDN